MAWNARPGYTYADEGPDPGCNAYCDPAAGIHTTVAYGPDQPTAGEVVMTCVAHGHPQGPAVITACEPAVEAPPPVNPRLAVLPAWLVTYRLVPS